MQVFRPVLTFLLLTTLLLARAQKPEAVEQANLGVSLAKKSDYHGAIQAYQRAIALDPGLPGIYLNLGLAWFKLGDFREAIAAFDKESAKSPNAQVSTLLAMSYFGLHQYREAAERLKPLAAAQPDNTELSYLLAKSYLWSGQTNEAMELFKALLNRDPNSVAAHMLMGEALDASYRTNDAIAEFEAAAKANPSQADVHFGLGYLYWKQKRYDEAEREFRTELENDPKNAQAAAYLGDVLMKNGRNQDAVPLLKKSVELRNDLHVPHEDLAIIYTDGKHYDAAINEFQAAIRAEPTSYDAHYRLARLYRELGRTAEADAEFKTVKKLHEQKTEEPLMKISGPR